MIADFTPRCPICGEPTMIAIHKDESDLPITQRIIGNTVISYQPINHTCVKEFLKNNNKLTTTKE